MSPTRMTRAERSAKMDRLWIDYRKYIELWKQARDRRNTVAMNEYGAIWGPAHEEWCRLDVEEQSSFKAGSGLQVFINQKRRPAQIIAIIEDEMLVEYDMPAGTSALLICGSYAPLKIIRSVSYGALSKRWCAAIANGAGFDTMTWNPQKSVGTAKGHLERAKRLADEARGEAHACSPSCAACALMRQCE